MPKLDRKAVSQQLNTARLTAAATLKSLRTSIDVYYRNGSLGDDLRRELEKVVYEIETSTRDDLNETLKLIEGGVEPLEICKTKVELLKTSFQSKILMVQAQLKTVVSRKETSEESAKKMVEWVTAYEGPSKLAARRVGRAEIEGEVEREVDEIKKAMYMRGDFFTAEPRSVLVRSFTTKRGSLSFTFSPAAGEREPGGALDQIREFFLNEQAIMEEQEYIAPDGENKSTPGCKFCGQFIGIIINEEGTPVPMSHADDCWWNLSKQAFLYLFG